MSRYFSSGVYPRTVDRSQFPSTFAPFIAGMTYQSHRGPMGLFSYFDRVDFQDRNGKANAAVGYGHYMGDHYFDAGTFLIGNRIAGAGARWATGSICQTPNAAGTSKVGTNYVGGPGYLSDPAGIVNTPGQAGEYYLVFAGPLVALNAFNMTVNTVGISQVAYQVTSNNTMLQIAAAIQARLDALGTGGRARVLPGTPGATADQYLIRITAPLDGSEVPVPLVFGTPTITLGTSQTTAQIIAPYKLFDVWAQNPSAWANNVGINLTPVGGGTPPRLKLSFNSALVTSNSFSCTLNGVAVGPVAFTTDSDTTMGLIATALQTAMVALGAGATAVVTQILGSQSNDRDIILTGPSNALIDIVVDQAVVTGGAGQAVATVTQLTRRIAPSNRFRLDVYEYPNVSTPVETFICALRDDIDSAGNNYNIENQVNVVGSGSKYIRVALNPALISTDNLLSPVSLITLPTRYAYLTGGVDGATATSSDYITGWQAFASRVKIDVRCLINAGVTAPEVQQAMAAIAAARQDCVALLDVPDGLNAQAISNWRFSTLNVDTCYAWAFGPWNYVWDNDNSQYLWVPMSGQVAALMAANVKNGHAFRSPAGIERSKLPRCQKLRYTFEDGEQDLLTAAGINYALFNAGIYYIANNQTLQLQKSYLSYANVVLMLIQVYITEMASFVYFEFQADNPNTWFRMRTTMQSLLQTFQDNEALDAFTVLCDAKTNTNDLISRGQMRMIVLMTPTVEGSEILIDNVIMRHGLQINEVLPTIT